LSGDGEVPDPGSLSAIASAAQRDVAALLTAVPNFRDAGDVAAGAGRRIREGVIFRSGQLADLPTAASRALGSLGVGLVVDLRTKAERRAQPDSLPTSVRLQVADVLADNPGSGAAKLAALASGSADALPIEAINGAIGGGRAVGLMMGSYEGFVALDSAKLAYRTFATEVARSEAPVVFHCTAGKDRTGWAAAMLQLFVGVSEQDVMSQYLGSNERIAAEFDPLIDKFAAAGVDADAMRALVQVRPQYLEAAVNAMTNSYGDIAGYLENGLGLSDADLSALHARLLD